MKCYDCFLEQQPVTLQPLSVAGVDNLLFQYNLCCLLFSGRIVIFPHNSKCLSVVKRTKPFASVSASEKSPGKCSWGLESCVIFVYHSNNTVSPKYLNSHVFLSISSNQAIFGHRLYHNTANCLTCCWHPWGTVYAQIIAEPVIERETKMHWGCDFLYLTALIWHYSIFWFFCWDLPFSDM